MSAVLRASRLGFRCDAVRVRVGIVPVCRSIHLPHGFFPPKSARAELKADVNATSKEGDTSLHKCAQMGANALPLVRVLLSHAAEYARIRGRVCAFAC